MTIYGYARVSTAGQSLEVQSKALKTAGCGKIFSEKQSGIKANRVQLAKAIAALVDGDLLIVTKIDRLARSTRDLLNSLDQITGSGAGFRSLGDPWCDTTTPHGKLLLTVLAGFAEFDREMIIARTSEGRRLAKANGVHMGRKSKLTPHQRHEALARLAKGTETLSDIGRSYGVSHTTISRLEA
ncbi:recombinase family protein [Bradyrhizobium sp. AUGA SZCCT0042]|uniref:recombinase family protein n=1 Tax=Bradyrhizobium sp. AUGA SZCCT0042 TaxID=2807651 RepID=UPI001BA56BD9|nr:recombinase family protein [Bradyrhizobium sp. AUGA SZCCT0042]MBR1301246.1 recombinase family protein [Bradyrhizobium sp. AUGA SZCCT0042]